MKIQIRYYPVIILVTFTFFVLLGLALGFRPQHGGQGTGSSRQHNNAIPQLITEFRV
jgi:hypothetical protein